MQSSEGFTEISHLENQLKQLKDQFDQAIKNDIQLGDLKKIFHEMKSLQSRIDHVTGNRSAQNQLDDASN